MSKKIYIFDTTLRDGEQTPGVNLNVQEKLEIAKQLQKLGVDVIEAGFPFASKGDFQAVKSIAQNIKTPVIVALARTSKNDIDSAWEAVKYADKPRIHIFIATSQLHMKYKLHMEPQEVLNTAIEMVSYAKSLCPSVEFSPEDGSRTSLNYLYKVIEAVIDAGADIVNIPDTVGYSTPNEYGAFIKSIKDNVPNIDKVIISVHCHNDLGLAVANSLAAVENGAEQIECAINGLGERAGNAALEEIVMAIKTRRDNYNCHTDIVTEQIKRTSALVSHMTGIQIQSNKAIVGANAFSHESGIHQHGMLSNRKTYEIMTPESIGLKKSSMVLGKLSGRHAFEQHLIQLGYIDLEPDTIHEAFLKFKDLADKKKVISDEDIEALIIQEATQIPEIYKLEYFQVSSGSSTVATSTVKIKHEDEKLEEASCGDGPVDATFRAIEKAIGVNVNLEEYYLKAIGADKDALGEVTLKIRSGNESFNGKGISTDVIEASARAYMNAINKMFYHIE